MFSLSKHFSRKTTFELMKLALPMVVSQVTFAVMIVTGRYFMSQIDPVSMAAAWRRSSRSASSTENTRSAIA